MIDFPGLYTYIYSMDWIKNIFRNSHEEPDSAEIEEFSEVLPVLPLKDAVLLPGAVLTRPPPLSSGNFTAAIAL